jgi:5'-nucleotidase/UDP-sugar diphosphatase
MHAAHSRRLDALRGLSVLAAAALLAACQPQAVRPAPGGTEPFSLRILHINDHHSRVAPDSGQVLLLDGEPTQVSFGGFPQLATAFGELAQGADHVLRLHAGDAMTGDLYYTLFAGEADADLMNQVCFDAFTVGNHEFDGGDAGLKRFLDFLGKRTWDCRTPALGANVRPAVGASPLAMFSARDYLLPRVVLERGGRRIGIVGIDVAGKTKASSSPDAGTEFLDEAATAQAQVDALRAEGVDIIVLMTHVGYQADLELAKSLRGVDVIVGGDSHSLLGEEFREFGLAVEGPYPTRLRNLDGDLVCVVQAWQYTWVVGALDVDFDDAGRVTACGGRPVLLLGDDLRRHGVPLEGAAREAAQARIAASPVLAHFDPEPRAEHVLDVYRRQIEAFAGEQVATVPERLCLRRVPGRHDRSRDGAPGCAAKTDVHGGLMQSLVAEVLRAQAARYGGADLALQNAGGVRNGLAEGAFTVGDAYLALPFKNTLVRLDMQGAELRAVLEEAIDYFLADQSANTGAWPYAAGLRWDVDLTRSRVEGRITRLEFWNGTAWEPLDPDRSYRVVANDYIAAGRDGYEGLAAIPASRREDTFLDYAQALVDFAREVQVLLPPPVERRSTQGFRDVDGRDYPPR